MICRHAFVPDPQTRGNETFVQWPALVGIGILLLMLGIIGHIRFMVELRTEHGQLISARMIPDDRFPYSGTLAIALLVLLLGLFAVTSIIAHIGPFG